MIYQAGFLVPPWLGYADFLERIGESSSAEVDAIVDEDDLNVPNSMALIVPRGILSNC